MKNKQITIGSVIGQGVNSILLLLHDPIHFILYMISRIRVHTHYVTKPQYEIQYVLDTGAREPVRAHAGDAGWDLYTLNTIDIPPRSFVDVSTGIYMQMDKGLWCRITSRSSTVRTWNLQVQEGIIDNGYTGELFIGVWNLTDEIITVPRNTRLAQIIFFECTDIAHWQQTDQLISTDGRGSKGFGSTGG